jgi:DNA-nicking Smr family endonuclease
VGRKNRRDGPPRQPQRGLRRTIRHASASEEAGAAGRRRRRGDPGPPPEQALHLRRLGAADALNRLEQRIRTLAQEGCRQLLVVHGRGHGSVGGQPILGPLVRRWCDEHPALVSCWSQAPPAWGGEGAIVVNLRGARRDGSG